MGIQVKKNMKIIVIFLLIFLAIFLIDIISYFNMVANHVVNYGILEVILPYIKNIIIVTFFIVYILINFKYIKENKNIKNILINIFLPIIILIVCVTMFLLIIKIYDFISNSTIFNIMIYDQTDLSLNDSNEYLIITNSRALTLADDGGSHYNTYYKIDLSKNLIIKYQDHYIGFIGYEYLGKVLYKKDLSSEEALQLENLLDTIFSNIETHSSSPFSYYFSNLDYSNVKVYNEDLIEEFESIVKK